MLEHFDSESLEGERKKWPKEVVAMAVRALNKVWYPMEDEYFMDRGLASTILDTKELPLLLKDPDDFDDYLEIEALQGFVGLIEGVETIDELHDFMRELQEMLVTAREAQAARLGMDVQQMSGHRSKMRKLISDAPDQFTIGKDGEEEGDKEL